MLGDIYGRFEIEVINATFKINEEYYSCRHLLFNRNATTHILIFQIGLSDIIKVKEKKARIDDVISKCKVCRDFRENFKL